jgi:hypothetical protein
MLRTVFLFLVASVLALPGAFPAAALTDLTPAQRAERIKALPPDERKWLEDYVAPIILPEEVQVFLQLTEPAQRERFKTAFWARREQPNLQPPLGPGYRTRYEHLRELAADFDGLPTTPASSWSARASRTRSSSARTATDLPAVEVWTYTQPGAAWRRRRSTSLRPSPAPPPARYSAIPQREVLASSALGLRGRVPVVRRAYDRRQPTVQSVVHARW